MTKGTRFPKQEIIHTGIVRFTIIIDTGIIKFTIYKGTMVLPPQVIVTLELTEYGLHGLQ